LFGFGLKLRPGIHADLLAGSGVAAADVVGFGVTAGAVAGAALMNR